MYTIHILPTLTLFVQVFVVGSSAVIGFLSVLIGRWLHLDYSTKLWAMTFVLVVMVRCLTEDPILTARILFLLKSSSPLGPRIFAILTLLLQQICQVLFHLPSIQLLIPAEPSSNPVNNDQIMQNPLII